MDFFEDCDRTTEVFVGLAHLAIDLHVEVGVFDHLFHGFVVFLSEARDCHGQKHMGTFVN